MATLVQAIPCCCHYHPHIGSWAIHHKVIALEMLMKIITTAYLKTTHLTHRGQVMHICISKLTIIGSDNGLSPDRCQASIWTNAGILLIGHLGTNSNEILIQICIFSLKKMHLKLSQGNRCPFCHCLNVLIFHWFVVVTKYIFRPYLMVYFITRLFDLHIEAETTWPTFRRHFQMRFLEWRYMNFN